MTWFKVDDGLWGHQKWRAASPAARGLWITAGSWCADQLTDGFVPRHILGLLGGNARQAQQLVDVGLWEKASGGWRFHQWNADGDGTARNPTREEVERVRAATRSRQRRARDKARESRVTDPRDDASVTRDIGVSHGPPDPTRPTEELTSSDALTTAEPTPDDDDPQHPPPIVCQTVAILAARDLAERQAVATRPPVADPAAWENTAYKRRLAVAWPLVELHREHPDWTAEQLADFAEPTPPASTNGARPDPRATAYDDQQAAARAAAEAHMTDLAEHAGEHPDPVRNIDAIARIRAQHPHATRTPDPDDDPQDAT